MFKVQLNLGELNQKAIQVELYAYRIMDGAPVREEMKRGRTQADVAGSYVYRVAVSTARLPADFAARVIPCCAGAAIPLEEARVMWKR